MRPSFIHEEDYEKKNVKLERPQMVENVVYPRGPLDISLLPNCEGYIAYGMK